MRIYIDGSGWNGRESKACIIHDTRTLTLIDTNKKTNNEMEYEALYLALLFAKDGDIIYTDSQLIVGQTKGNWKINCPHLQTYVNIIEEKLKDIDVTIEWMPRNLNPAGRILERLK